MKLYEVTQALEAIIDDFDIESQADVKALPDEVKAKISELKDDYHGKLTNIWGLIKNYCAEAEALRAEKQRLADRQATAERRADWLKQYVAFCLGEGVRWKSPDGTRQFGWRKSEAAEVVDREAIPDCYRVFDWEPALSEIKKDIKSGAEVPGAVISKRQNLQVK